MALGPHPAIVLPAAPPTERTKSLPNTGKNRCRDGRLAKHPTSELLGNFTSCRAKSTDTIQCPPSHIFRVVRDSGGIRLLRVLAVCRHFSAHAKAILLI